MAIKIIDVESADDEVEDIIQEIAILGHMKSPHVTSYYGSYLKGTNLWIIMEYCAGGSCSELLKPGSIAEDYIAIIMREMLLALEYLHDDQKLHRDIKGMCHLFVARTIRLTQFVSSCQHPGGLEWTHQAR